MPAHRSLGVGGKKTVAKARTKVRAAKKVKAAKIKITGRVVHFYDRISVAIVELAAPLKVGDNQLVELMPRVGVIHGVTEPRRHPDHAVKLFPVHLWRPEGHLHVLGGRVE